MESVAWDIVYLPTLTPILVDLHQADQIPRLTWGLRVHDTPNLFLLCTLHVVIIYSQIYLQIGMDPTNIYFASEYNTFNFSVIRVTY